MSSFTATAKNWCFTLNNYTEDEYSSLIDALAASSNYSIVGKEVGDSGTPHLQGYTILSRRCNLSHVRNLLSPRVHLEVARGTPRQNRLYCSKGGDFTESGTLPGRTQGKSRDELATEFRSAIQSGSGGLVQFSESNPGTWYFSGHNLLRNSLSVSQAINRPNIAVEWIYGEPGVGKSRYAHEKFPDAYIKDPRTKWWNNYLLETTVIIDDFGPGGIDINHLLRWFDRYKCIVENKGGMVALHADTFIVTSNFHPETVFTDNLGSPHPQIPALLRRITLVNFPLI